MGEWLARMLHEAEVSAAVLKQACELLANTPVPEPAAKWIVEMAYPFPSPPRDNAPSEVMRKRRRNHQKLCERIRLYRRKAADLFAGWGTGMDVPAAKGTLWGLYNAVVETEVSTATATSPAAWPRAPSSAPAPKRSSAPGTP